jgi:hypothetical protein
VALVLIGASGCSGKATVQGKVIYQGRLVSHGTVIVLGSDHVARTGIIQADGSYTISGLRPGDYKIGVISRDPSAGRSSRRRNRQALSGAKPTTAMEAAGPWFPLPGKYENPETSGLSHTLGSGNNQHDVELN